MVHALLVKNLVVRLYSAVIINASQYVIEVHVIPVLGLFKYHVGAELLILLYLVEEVSDLDRHVVINSASMLLLHK